MNSIALGLPRNLAGTRTSIVKVTVTAPDKTRLEAATRDILKSLDQPPSSGSSFSKAQSLRTTVFSTPGISKMQYESKRARTNNRTGNDGIWNVTLVNKNGNVDGNDGCLELGVRFGFDQPNIDTRLDTWLEDARTRARSPALGNTPLTQLRTSPTSLISPGLGRTKLSPSKAGQADAINRNGDVTGNDELLESRVGFGFDQPNTDTRLDTWLEDARTRARSPALGHTPLTHLRTSPTSLISPGFGRTKLSPSKAGQADAALPMSSPSSAAAAAARVDLMKELPMQGSTGMTPVEEEEGEKEGLRASCGDGLQHPSLGHVPSSDDGTYSPDQSDALRTAKDRFPSMFLEGNGGIGSGCAPAVQLQVTALQPSGCSNDPIIMNVQVHNTNNTVYNVNNARGDVNHITNNDGSMLSSFCSRGHWELLYPLSTSERPEDTNEQRELKTALSVWSRLLCEGRNGKDKERSSTSLDRLPENPRIESSFPDSIWTIQNQNHGAQIMGRNIGGEERLFVHTHYASFFFHDPPLSPTILNLRILITLRINRNLKVGIPRVGVDSDVKTAIDSFYSFYAFSHLWYLYPLILFQSFQTNRYFRSFRPSRLSESFAFKMKRVPIGLCKGIETAACTRQSTSRTSSLPYPILYLTRNIPVKGKSRTQKDRKLEGLRERILDSASNEKWLGQIERMKDEISER
ncbi:hypothetical protein EV360DRAFT_68515 [Lentinula raphanica]|nr:hypothetical protein EV360DRAFT_68515 [Lentinula raphanica]